VQVVTMGNPFEILQRKKGCPIMMLILLFKPKQASFGLLQGAIPSCMMEKHLPFFTHDGKPFTNVRSIIEDKKGNIWLGGNDGLWRYDGKTFTNFTPNFVGYIYEDKKGNIWTSSERDNSQAWALSQYDGKSLSGFVSAKGQWVLSRYDEKSLSNKRHHCNRNKARRRNDLWDFRS